MSHFHIIVDPSSSALNEITGNRVGDQLHIMTGYLPDLELPGVLGVFEWDGQFPYVIQHKGDYSARTMGYAGWPELTKPEFENE